MTAKRRKQLRLAGFAVLLPALVWGFLPNPEIYPPGHDWSRLVTDRGGKALHLSITRDARYRIFTPLREISPQWIDATLTKEDRWFHWHPGVNPASIVRAAWGALTGNPAGGASTLTMQVARLRWNIESRSFTGKFIQICRAIQLERHYNKNQILEAYFNLAPYGGNVEGAGAAALLWCGHPPSEVTQREAIALSIIPQSPTSRHPGMPGNTIRIAHAQARLASLLEADSKLRTDPLADAFTLSPQGPPPHEAPHFCRRLMRDFDGAALHSTLDSAMQHELEQGILNYLERTRERGISNACAILVHAPSREVLAYVGSADYSNREIHGMVDGVQALRSPGSALKPFIYGLAMDQGLIHPRSLVTDEPVNFHNYNPENFDGHFLGPIHADEALVRSRNIPAVDLSNRVKRDSFYQLLRHGGVPLTQPPSYYGLALALGGFGISPEQLAQLYAALADDGLPKPLVFSKEQKAKTTPGHALLSTPTRFLVLNMLRGSGALGIDDRYSKNDPTVAWKTGTSHGFRDAWAAGVRGNQVLIVWLGNFNGQGNNALVAHQCAVPLMFDLFARLHTPEKPIIPPSELRQVELCAVSGEIPSPWCEQQSRGWFIPGVSPISMCSIHRQILVDGSTGVRVAHDDGRPNLKREIHEFWSPDMLELFRKAGLPRRSPPAPEQGTESLSGTDPGMDPKITSPLPGRTYQTDGSSAISLIAKTAPGVIQCYWFSGDAFIGTSHPNEGLDWQAQTGNHKLRVIDDHGRSHEIPIKVVGH